MVFKRIRNRIDYEFSKLQAAYYAKKVLFSFDESWFKDKRVAIIGGADSVLKQKLGEYIDGFDVVVRINKGVEVIDEQNSYLGTKTDVLFHCFYERENDKGSSPVTPELWLRHQVGTLIFSHNYKCSRYSLDNFNSFVKKTKAKYKFSQVPSEFYSSNEVAVKPYGPTTGFIAINTVFNCQPRELYITGVTFFKTPHNASYRDFDEKDLENVFKVNQSHNAELEYQHVKRLYVKYPEILIPDITLKHIFQTN